MSKGAKSKTEEKFYGTGRRKTAIAKVWIKPGAGKFLINGRDYKDCICKRKLLENQLLQPLIVTELQNKLDVRATVLGGGVCAQAGAISLGLARALLAWKENFKNILRNHGLLTRDARAKERKKYGRKRARRRFQFTKR
jgi:small subunit ribosomal protein S9